MCEEELAAEKTNYILTLKLYSPSSWTPRVVREVEEWGSEVEPGEEQPGEVCVEGGFNLS